MGRLIQRKRKGHKKEAQKLEFSTFSCPCNLQFGRPKFGRVNLRRFTSSAIAICDSHPEFCQKSTFFVVKIDKKKTAIYFGKYLKMTVKKRSKSLGRPLNSRLNLRSWVPLDALKIRSSIRASNIFPLENVGWEVHLDALNKS